MINWRTAIRSSLQHQPARQFARLIPAFLLLLHSAGAPAQENEFDAALAALAEASSYADKEAAAMQLVDTGDERVEEILNAFLDGELYTLRASGELVYAEEVADGYAIVSVVNGESGGEVGRRGVARVSINNSLRGRLRELLAAFGLSHEDPDRRRAAVRTVAETGDLAMLDTLESLREQESSASVLKAIDAALAVLNLDSPDTATRIDAIGQMHANPSGYVRTKLVQMSNDDSADEALRAAADEALLAIETRMKFFEIIKTVFFGLSLGSILVLAAIGLSVTFGIMGVINMAHGELIMLGAYTTWVVQQLFPSAIDLSLLIAVPLAFCVSGLVGIAIERGIVRFLYGRPLETLLATFGVSLVLQQTVRSVFSPLNRAVSTPSWMSGSLEILPGLEITLNRLVIIVFSLMVFGMLLFVLKRTRLGLEMRAVTQSRSMARAMGIRTARVDALTFGLGAGVAGVAGVALSQLTNVGPNLGQAYIVDSFMVVVFGGVGNIWGTFVGGLTLGVANKVVEPAVGAVMAKILVLVFLIIFIQKRPRGIFPQKGRAAEG
jgi:urea transport system permease protein